MANELMKEWLQGLYEKSKARMDRRLKNGAGMRYVEDAFATKSGLGSELKAYDLDRRLYEHQNRKLDRLNHVTSRPDDPYVVRYHFTPKENVDRILDEGLVPMVGDNQKLNHDPSYQQPAVFTYINAEAEPWRFSPRFHRDIPLRIEIPRERYESMERFDRNPNYSEEMRVPNGVQSIERGGYSDIFKEAIPAEYISVYKYPEGHRFIDMEKDWEPGKPSIKFGTSGGKIHEAWRKNRKEYPYESTFLDAVTDMCRDMGFNSTAECGSYFLEPTTVKKGIPQLMMSRFIHNKPPIVETVDPSELERWRLKNWNNLE